LKQQITPEQYKTMVEDGSICDALAQYPVKEDDVFFLPAGRIHAIGAGCFLAEIQQTSDVTYRIYDFMRKDKDGNYRQLHTEEAAEAIDYTVYNDYRTQYTPCKNQVVKLVECPYFTTSVYDIDSPTPIEAVAKDTFVILIVLKGEGTVTTDGGESVSVKVGDTLLIAAENTRLEIDGNIKLLETHID
jgi:mannose-6-phosphate isomerase